MASRTEKLRRRQHRKDKKKRMRGPGSDLTRPGDMVFFTPPGAFKMSEALWELIEPECEPDADDEALRRLLFIGVAAWNASLTKDDEKKTYLERIARILPFEVRQGFYEIVESLIHRKVELFPHIQRPILNFDLTWLPSGDPHLTVAYGLI